MASPSITKSTHATQQPPKGAPKASLWAAVGWVQEVLEARILGQATEILRLLKKVECMKVDQSDAATSGLAFLLAQHEIWVDLPEWGCKPKDFCDKVCSMAKWLAEVDRSDEVALWHQRVALQLVGRGFHAPSHLDGLPADTATKFCNFEKGKCLLRNAVTVAASQAAAKRAKLAHVTVARCPSSASAEELASTCLQQGASNESEPLLELLLARPSCALLVRFMMTD